MTQIDDHAAEPNLCNICIDQVLGEECAGRLYHYYRPEAKPFANRYEMLRTIEHLCDWLDYPQESDRPRSFANSPASAEKPKEMRVKRCMSREKLTEARGEKATFVVHVMYRQNATWQGSVTWAETERTANFRSAMELFKLMDSAVRMEPAAIEDIRSHKPVPDERGLPGDWQYQTEK